MKTGKPFVNVGLMEFTYDLERNKLLSLLKEKASYVKYLDSQEYFEKPGTDVLKSQIQVNKYRSELDTIFGFVQVSSEMKNSYECQLESIYDTYNEEIQSLQEQLLKLKRENEILERLSNETTESLYEQMKILIRKGNENDKN